MAFNLKVGQSKESAKPIKGITAITSRVEYNASDKKYFLSVSGCLHESHLFRKPEDEIPLSIYHGNLQSGDIEEAYRWFCDRGFSFVEVVIDPGQIAQFTASGNFAEVETEGDCFYVHNNLNS